MIRHCRGHGVAIVSPWRDGLKKRWIDAVSGALTGSEELSGIRPCQSLDVDTRRKRILLNEYSARLDFVAHQFGEQHFRLVRLLNLHLQERTGVHVERGFPELLRVHLAEPFVPLQRDAFSARLRQRFEQAHWTKNTGLLVTPSQHGWWRGTRKSVLEAGGILIKLACFGGADQRLIDDGDVLYAAHGALKMEAFFVEAAFPAALGLVLQRI